MTPHRSPALARLQHVLADADAPLVRADLRRHCSDRTIERAVQQGLVVPLSPGLIASPHHGDTLLTRLTQVQEWMPEGALIAGPAAAWVWGMRHLDIPVIDVCVNPSARLRPPPGTTVWRTTASINPTRVGPFTTAPKAHVPVQAWARSNAFRNPGAVLDVIRALRIRADLSLKALSRYPRIPQRAELTQLLTMASDGVTSALEYIAKSQVFTGPEWDDWVWQARVDVPGRTAVVDMLHREAKVAVEFDGARFHSNDNARRRDIERDATLSSAGYLTVRFTYEDVTQRPEWCRQRVRDTLRSRQHPLG